MRRLLLVALAACGSKAGSTPLASGKPPAPVVSTSCADAGILLSQIYSDGADSVASRGDDLAKQCVSQKWSRSVLDCVGAAAKDGLLACIERLSMSQQTALQEVQARWYSGGAGMYGGVVAPVPFDPPPPAVDCSTAIGDAARFAPAIGLSDANRSLAIGLRTYTLNQVCVGWTSEKRECLTAGTTTDAAAECLGDDPDVRARLATVDALVKKVAAKRARAGEITCAAVVAAHYGDAAWKGKPAADKKTVVDARERMTKACADESWSDDLRACIAVDGGDACFVAAGLAPLWGYPPGGGLPVTGVPDCDEYGAETARLMACQAAPQETRDTWKQQYEQYAQAINRMNGPQKSQFAESCRQMIDAVHEVEMQSGCP